jgi:hypothetical protein
MRIEMALLGALALASLAQGCGSKTVNNANTTNTVNTDGNTNAKTQANNNNPATPSPSPGRTENNARVNGNSNVNADTPPKNQNKIPYYGELGNDAPPAKAPVKKPEPKSSPR